MVMGLAACAPSQENATKQKENGGQSDDVLVLRAASNNNPGNTHYEGFAKFIEVVEEISDGKIKIEFYPSGQLYDLDGLYPAIKRGQIDMAYDFSATTFAQYTPYTAMYGAPYVYENYEHMTAVLNGELGQRLFDRVAQDEEIRPLQAWYLGSRNLNLVEDKKIETPQDLKGVNLRSINAEGFINMVRALGAQSQPLAFTELYTALQTRTIDGHENPLTVIKNNNLHEVTKSITITQHLVDGIWVTINEERWQSLTEQQQEWILEALEEGKKVADGLVLDAEEELIDYFEQNGISVYYPDVKAFSDYVENYYIDNGLADDWNLEELEELKRYIK